jgi:hypothetical protein
MNATGLLLLSLVSATLNPSLTKFLTAELGLPASAVAGIQTDILVEQLPVENSSREIAVIGVVPINVSSQFFLDSFRHTETFLESAELKQIGTFSRPPMTADVAALQLAADDLKAIEQCKIADCKVKLPAQDIGAFQKLDWSSRDVANGATQLFHTRLTGYVQSYLERGNSALMVYADKPKQMALADGFGQLLDESAHVSSLVPDLQRYLKEFPDGSPPGTEDIVYWTIEDFGYRPVTTVTHATIYDHPVGQTARAIIAQKQIYASHYFHARFTLMALTEASDRPNGKGLYLVYVDRSLFDDDLGTINRGILGRGLTKSLRGKLESLRERLEAAYVRNTH